MFTVDLLFVWMLKYLVVTFLILGAAALLLRVIRQPVEKVSLIKITLVSLVFALFVSTASWLPKIELQWLPAKQEVSMKPAPAIRSIDTPPIHAQNHFTRINASSNRFVEKSESANTTQVIPTSSPEIVADIPEVVLATSSASSTSNATSFDWLRFGKSILVWTVIAVSFLQLAHVLLGYFATRRLLKKSSKLPCHDQARIRAALCKVANKDVSHVDVRSSEQIQVPIVLGITDPCILLPVSIVDMESSPQQLEHCLAHEWKHVDRNDLLIWGLASLLQPLLWMQPFYWVLRRELRVNQDQIADQFAAEATERRIDYAETLVKFSRSFHTNMMGALSMSGSKSNVYRRVEMLLNAKFPLANVSRRNVVLGLVALMAAGSVTLASLQLVNAGHTGTSNWMAPQEDGEKSGKEESKDDDKKATEAVEYVGVVRDKTTKEPVANAIVTVRRENSKTRKTIEETKHTTNAQGEYKFSIPPEQQNERYLYIELDVEHDTYCSKKGFGYAYSMIVKNLELGEPPFFTEIMLSQGEEVSGRIVDENGKPLEGVEVSGYSVPVTDGSTFEYGSFDETVTDAEGRFKMNYAKDGNSILWVKPDNYACVQVMTGNKRGDLGDIQLEKGYTISGKVVDALGNPAAGVWLELGDSEAQAEIQMPVATSMTRYAKTDDEGRYTMKPMRAARHEIKVRKSGPAIDENGNEYWDRIQLPGVFPSQRVEIKAQEQPQVVNLQGIPHVYVSGKFVNAKGEPTSGHMPHLFGKVNDDYMFFEGEKGEEKGDFFIMVPHGMQDAKISFITNEHSALKIKVGDGEVEHNTRDIDLGTLEEDFTEITVYRYVAPILQIKVVDENGENLDDVNIGAIYEGEETGQYNPINGPATSVFFEKQKDGYHRSSQLCPDSKFEYFAQMDGYERASEKLEMKENETKQVTLTLKKKSADANDATADSEEQMMKDDGK